MDEPQPNISPDDYAEFVANLRAFFDAARAASRDGGLASDDAEDSPGPAIERDLMDLFASGMQQELEPEFLESLMGALHSLAPQHQDSLSLPGWAEFVARLFRYEQDFLIDLEEVALPDAQKRALRRQMVSFFRGLAAQLTGHLGSTGDGTIPRGFRQPIGAAQGPATPSYQSLLHAISDPACLCDADARIRYINPAFRSAVPQGIEPLGTLLSQWVRWDPAADSRDRAQAGTWLGWPSQEVPVIGIWLPDIGPGVTAVVLRLTVAERLLAPPEPGFHEADQLRHENQRLRNLYRSWVAMSASASEEELLPLFLRRLHELVPWGAAAVLLTDQSSTPRIWTSLTAEQGERWSGLTRRLMESFELFTHQPPPSGTPRLVHLALPGSEGVAEVLPSNEAVALPLVAGDRVWGALALYRDGGLPYSSLDVQAIAILAHGLAAIWRQLLTTRQLQRTNDAISQELRFARRVQRNFLPQPTRDPALRIVTRFVPASLLSGDFYLFDQPADGPVTILIGDVAGHGLSAALMMMTMVGIFTELLPTARERFGELLPLANIACCQVLEENYFVTVQALRIDAKKHEITIANAGHPPPLHLEASGQSASFIESSALPLGMFPDAIYTLKHVPCHPGDRVLCYTDGLIEARDASGRGFGRDRLRLMAIQERETPSPFLLDRLVDAAQAHHGAGPLDDDVALICIDLNDRDRPG
ncbi:MAG: GAF domain-containing SpoIIE family protein phosphatase [bacterium]